MLQETFQDEEAGSPMLLAAAHDEHSNPDFLDRLRARDEAAETEPDREQLQRLENHICDCLCKGRHGAD